MLRHGGCDLANCGRGGDPEAARAQLGSGTTSYATSPVRVVGLEDLPIADISAGGWHSLALTTTGGACPPAIGVEG